jgi:predicted NAD-dependent protein-ADP-ribosyltransferase YbiA (DUF1768 family)
MQTILLDKRIQHMERKKIDPEDADYKSAVYEIEMCGYDVKICFGKGKLTYCNSENGIVYFPIYLIVELEAKCQIGLYFIHSKECIESGNGNIDDIMEHLQGPVLYSFAEDLIKQYYQVMEKEEEKEEDEEETKIEENKKDNIPDNYKEIFTKVSSQNSIANLPVETKEEAEKIVIDYTGEKGKRKDDCWIQRYMKNPNYNIHETESNGDCFFAVLRDAFKSIGFVTEVLKFRTLLSENMSNEHYQYYINIYNIFDTEIKRVTQTMEEISANINKHRKNAKTNTSIENTRSIVNICSLLTKEYDELSLEKKELERELLLSIGNIQSKKELETIEKFKEYVKTSTFWADDFSIAFLEKALKIKMIIFEESIYEESSMRHVLNCGPRHEFDTPFQPLYYIMTSYSGNHYTLISYKNKKIFTYEEIPYHVKNMIATKCMETEGKTFSTIKEFQNFMKEEGLTDENENENEEDTPTSSTSNPAKGEVIFMFYASSQNRKFPGKGANEIIPQERLLEFKELNELSKKLQWRKILDDSWMDIKNPFIIDGKKYASVIHYMESSKFIKEHPDFAAFYSMNSNSKMAIHLSKNAAKLSLDGEPPTPTIDRDFESRKQIEYEKALMSKFSQNDDYKRILTSTKDATLLHFRPFQKPEVATTLMEVRNKLSQILHS